MLAKDFQESAGAKTNAFLRLSPAHDNKRVPQCLGFTLEHGVASSPSTDVDVSASSGLRHCFRHDVSLILLRHWQ